MIPCCQSDSKILILCFFITAYFCFRDVTVFVSPMGYWFHITFEVPIFSRCFVSTANSSDFRIGRLAFKILALLKYLLIFGFMFVLEIFFFVCTWTNFVFTACNEGSEYVAWESASTISSEVQILLFVSPGSVAQNCFSHSSIIGTGDKGKRRSLSPRLCQSPASLIFEIEAALKRLSVFATLLSCAPLDCMSDWFSNAQDVTANSQKHYGI